MQELSLHVLDIAQNSIRAQATEVKISVEEMVKVNKLIIRIEDNGCGMEEELLKNITNPFTTTRKLRKVGLGVPFMAQMCEECGGQLKIQSEVGKGTILEATMQYDHIDRLPVGNMAESIITLIMSRPEIKFVYKYRFNEKVFEMTTEELKTVLGEVPINDFEILKWIKEYIISGEKEIK